MKLSKKTKSFYLFLMVGVIAISIVLFVQNELPAQHETSGWKIYINEKWGYSFKYPKSWYLEEPTILITTIRPWERKKSEYSDPKRDIDITVYPTKEDWPDFQKAINLGQIKMGKEVLIGGEWAKEYQEIVEGGYTYKHILIQKNERLFKFSVYEKHSQIEIFNEIIKSFEFI